MKQSQLKRTPMSKRSPRQSSVTHLDQRWRASAKALYGSRCAFAHCNEVKDLVVHHIYGKKAFPHLRHAVDNALVCCVEHHKYIHDYPTLGKTEIHNYLGRDASESLYTLAHQGGKSKKQEWRKD